MAVVRMINHRNPHISILAISLLDTLVENCGYAFHLQIATKEFLNEMVRRFPERPPPFPGPVMSRILQTIHGWKEGICVKSRWKEDLGNIRDMHRLLTFKGTVGNGLRIVNNNNDMQATDSVICLGMVSHRTPMKLYVDSVMIF
jgi:ADP-ribosylation factor-binding protein GGA